MVGKNSLPFTIYSARNADKSPAGTYLGQASKKTNLVGSYDYFPNHAETCAKVFIFARIVGTRNTKITRPTTENPYIYISTRGYQVEKLEGHEATSILYQYEDYKATLRTLASDESITIRENSRHDYELETKTYDFDNVCNINGLYYRRLGVPGKSDVVWMMKNIVGSNFIDVQSNDEQVIISFDPVSYGETADSSDVVDTKRGEYNLNRWYPNMAKSSCKES